MKKLLTILLMAVSVARAQVPIRGTFTTNITNIQSNGTSASDTAAVQAAVDSIYTAGGGIVQLGAGTYDIVPAAGKGIMLKSGVTLKGVGPATILKGITVGSDTAFCVVANYAYDTATTDYSAHSIKVEDLSLTVDATSGGSASNCHSLIGVGHAPSSEIRRVTFNGCYYHGLEFNRCGAVNGLMLVEDCVFTGSYNQSMPLELDGGGALGLVSATPRTKTVRNVLVNRCRFERRPSTDTPASGTCALLTHNAADILERCKFQDCYFSGLNSDTYTATCPLVCVSDASFSMARNLAFDGCVFEGFNRANNYGLYAVADASAENIDGFTVRNCQFVGRWTHGILVGAGTTDTTATLHNTRRGIRIENNVFVPTMAVSSYQDGLATAGASGTLTDSTQAWTTNFFANSTVSIVNGTGVGQTKTITSNTGTVLTISGTFSPVPDATSYYRIDRQYGAGVTTGALTGTPTTTSLSDSTRQWVANELNGFYLTMTSGTQNGQSRQITANTTTALTVSAFASAPAAADTYRIDATTRHTAVHAVACQDVVINGNRFTYPYDSTGIATPGLQSAIITGTCRTVTVNSNVLQYLHTASQLAAPTGGNWVPVTADLTKLETNTLQSSYTAIGNTLECTSNGVWNFFYEPTNSDSRTAAWTYVTGLVTGNTLLAGTTSSGVVGYWQRHDLSSPPRSQAQSFPTVASATTIAPVTPVFFVSGSTTIQTITAQVAGGATGSNGLGNQITIIPASGATWVTGTSGNIAIASTAVVSKALIMTYDPQTAKWYPSY